MKFMHLADLHIGKRVNGFSMLEDQKYILDQILKITDEQKPDGVLIAGDVYDKAIPSAEAVQLLDDFLVRLTKKTKDIYMISGNHDSAERVSFANRLLEDAGLHIASVYDGTITPVEAAPQVKVWMIPFTKPMHVRGVFPEEAEEVTDYTSAMKVLISHLDIMEEDVNIAVVHQFLTGASSCDSEEVNVGSLDNVDASVFDIFDYVALGHLHGPQRVSRDHVRYAGSPLKYSFSEMKQKKSVTMINIEKGSKKVQIDTIMLEPLHDLKEIRGEFESLISDEFRSPLKSDDYYRIILTDEQDVTNAAGRLRSYYPNFMELKYDNTRTRTEALTTGAEAVEERSPLDIFCELFEKQNGKSLNEEQQSMLQDMIESVRKQVEE